MTRHIALVSILFLGAAACSEQKPASPEPIKNTPPAALDGAHDAYLTGDYASAVDRVRDVLVDHASTKLERDNAYELLDATFEAGKGRVPMRIALPAGFEGVKFGAVHGSSQQGPFFHAYLYGRAKDFSHVVNISVRRLGDRDGVADQVILDMAGNLGELSHRKDMPGWDSFVLESQVPSLPEDGVFVVRIALDDGTIAEPWFVGHALASSGTPEMKSPTSSASLREERPEIEWTPFRSAENASFEWRTLSVWVGYGKGEREAWSFWRQNYGDLGKVRVENVLSPGDYWLNVTAGEGRDFGPIAVSRDSRTVLPFHIAE